MAIPENQFEVWSHQGATASAAAIYQRIQNALKAAPELAGKDFEVYLQGSYKNDTNIHGDSDVDVIVELNSTFMPDTTTLDPRQKSLYEASYPGSAQYRYADFRRDVLAAIRRGFPNHNVQEGGKSIKIPRTQNNLPADVVPCLEYRKYKSFAGVGAPGTQYVEGIWLWDKNLNTEVISYPKPHYNNGVWKHNVTSSWSKPSTRIFKNARGWMVDHGLITADSAPSYYVECLLYNVPNDKFGSSYVDTYVNAVNWLIQTDLSRFVCQNEQYWLFGAGQWSQDDARRFINGLVQTWQQWGQGARVRF